MPHRKIDILIISLFLLMIISALALYWDFKKKHPWPLDKSPFEAEKHIGKKGDEEIYEILLKDLVFFLQENRELTKSDNEYFLHHQNIIGVLQADFAGNTIEIYKKYFISSYSSLPEESKQKLLLVIPSNNQDIEMLELLKKEYEKSIVTKNDLFLAIHRTGLSESTEFLLTHIDVIYQIGDNKARKWWLEHLTDDCRNNPENLKLICESLDNLNEETRMEVEKILESAGVSCDVILGSTEEGESGK